MENNFLNKYLVDLSILIKNQLKHTKKLKKIGSLLSSLKKNKLIVFGNGGSAAIASHAAIDFSNVLGIKTMNFSDSSLITCLSNDYGYANWMSKAIEVFGDKNDILLLVSSSGESKNIINACFKAKEKKFKKIITFTGFNKNNSVSKLGDVNIWINSKNYNFVENTHQILILSIVDYLKNKNK